MNDCNLAEVPDQLGLGCSQFSPAAKGNCLEKAEGEQGSGISPESSLPSWRGLNSCQAQNETLYLHALSHLVLATTQ